MGNSRLALARALAGALALFVVAAGTDTANADAEVQIKITSITREGCKRRACPGDVRVYRNKKRLSAKKDMRLQAQDLISTTRCGVKTRITITAGKKGANFDLSDKGCRNPGCPGFQIRIKAVDSDSIDLIVTRGEMTTNSWGGFEVRHVVPDPRRRIADAGGGPAVSTIISQGTMYVVSVPGPRGAPYLVATFDGAVEVKTATDESTKTIAAGHEFSQGKTRTMGCKSIKYASETGAALDIAEAAGKDRCNCLTRRGYCIHRCTYVKALSNPKDGETRLNLVEAALQGRLYSTALYHLSYVEHEGRSSTSDWNRRLRCVKAALGKLAEGSNIAALMLK